MKKYWSFINIIIYMLLWNSDVQIKGLNLDHLLPPSLNPNLETSNLNDHLPLDPIDHRSSQSGHGHRNDQSEAGRSNWNDPLALGPLDQGTTDINKGNLSREDPLITDPLSLGPLDRGSTQTGNSFDLNNARETGSRRGQITSDRPSRNDPLGSLDQGHINDNSGISLLNDRLSFDPLHRSSLVDFVMNDATDVGRRDRLDNGFDAGGTQNLRRLRPRNPFILNRRKNRKWNKRRNRINRRNLLGRRRQDVGVTDAGITSDVRKSSQLTPLTSNIEENVNRQFAIQVRQEERDKRKLARLKTRLSNLEKRLGITTTTPKPTYKPNIFGFVQLDEFGNPVDIPFPEPVFIAPNPEPEPEPGPKPEPEPTSKPNSPTTTTAPPTTTRRPPPPLDLPELPPFLAPIRKPNRWLGRQRRRWKNNRRRGGGGGGGGRDIRWNRRFQWK